MNNTPRTLNRILIGILGLKLLAVGLLLVALATVPAAPTAPPQRKRRRPPRPAKPATR